MPKQHWHGDKVLVTGATGLVGSWLVAELVKKDADVTVLIHDLAPQSELVRSGCVNKTNVINGALEDLACLERCINKNEISTVFHLGAQAIVSVANRNPLATMETNIRGTYNLLEACRKHNDLVRRIVVASSDKAYGESPILPYTEGMPLSGKHPYEVSKSCADLITQSYAHTYNLPAVTARCGNIFGGGDLNWSRIIPGTIRSWLQGQAPIVRSDGTFVRDYIYVKDVVSAYLKLAESLEESKLAGQSFNFSPQQPLSVMDVVQMIGKIIVPEGLSPIILNQSQGEIKSQYLNAEKATRVLGWQPRYSTEEGLRETIDWYRRYLDNAN